MLTQDVQRFAYIKLDIFKKGMTSPSRKQNKATRYYIYSFVVCNPSGDAAGRSSEIKINKLE